MEEDEKLLKIIHRYLFLPIIAFFDNLSTILTIICSGCGALCSVCSLFRAQAAPLRR